MPKLLSFLSTPSRIVLAVTLVLCALCIGFKIHFSSVGAWASYMGRSGEVPGLIYGEPKPIRSDEWLLGVPWLLSQAHTNPSWATNNPSVGPDTSALLVGLPTSHWTAFFRPAHWGFYIFDVERGFSWFWMWRTVILFSALVLLLIELNSGLIMGALAGAIWIFFSGFVQWWLASVAEMLAYWTLACVAVRYISVSTSYRQLILWSLALLIMCGGFGLSLYPPFQVPLAYLGLALLPFLTRGLLSSNGPRPLARFASVAVVVSLAMAAVVSFLLDNSEAVSAMAQTVYPGRRVSLGGDLSLWRLVSGFFERNYTQYIFPPVAGNISEASSFVFLWPVSLVLLLFIKDRRELMRFLPIALYLVFLTLWGMFGIPESVAAISGWSFVPTSRALIGWGVGGVVLCVLMMRPQLVLSKLILVVFFLVASAGILWCVTAFPERFPVAIAEAELYYSASLLIASVAALIFRSGWLLALSVFALCAWPHSQVNPIMHGLAVITEEPLVSAVKRFDPNREGRWAVFGSVVHAQLVKITGRDVVNGSQYVPDMKAFTRLDPEGRATEIYNRYAHIGFTIAPEGTAPTFNLIAADTWELKVDPCHPRFIDFGVRYLVWANYQSSRRFECYERVFVGKDFAVYKGRS